MNRVTLILNSLARGGSHAAEELIALVCRELRRLAAARLTGEPAGAFGEVHFKGAPGAPEFRAAAGRLSPPLTPAAEPDREGGPDWHSDITVYCPLVKP